MNPSQSRLLGRAVEIFEKALASHPDARSRLRAWNVEHPERFRIGVVDDALLKLTPSRGPAIEQLKALGLLDAAGQQRFVGCITIPCTDERGEIANVAFYDERRELSWLRAETPAWWNGTILKRTPTVTIAADPLSAMAIENGIAPAGPASSISPAAKELLKLHAPRITFAPGAGGLAAQLGLGPRSRILRQDANGFVLEGPRGIEFHVQGLVQDSPRHLRASLKVLRPGGPIHLDTFDLYVAKSRAAFARNAACLLAEEPILMETLLAELVGLAEDWLKEQSKPAPSVVVTSSEREEAMELLRDPRLLDRVAGDFASLGHVGEETNKLIAYVASVSRKLDEPLSVLVVSRSGAGKSTLAESAALVAPPEEVLRFTRLTAQTLYYQKPDALAHKLLVIEEEKGVADAAYALRALQSARRLSLSSAAGQGGSQKREVAGPVSLFVTTTSTDVDEETASRFLVLSADESSEQTERILAAQRAAESRIVEREKILRVHRNAQRLLRPVKIANPWAPQLTFPHRRLSARRDQKKYLGLIRAVAFVRQFQRETDGETVTVALDDIAVANRLANEALGQSLYDLSPSSRRLLVEIREWLLKRKALEEPFRQRDLREHTGWRKSQLAEHLRELVETEYLAMRMKGRTAFYLLDWDGKGLEGGKFLSGLVDPSSLCPPHVRPMSGNEESRPNRRSGAAR